MVKVVFLGIGGWISRGCLGQSSIAIVSQHGSTLLLDAGEGTYYALERLNIDLANIRGIYVSHRHGDHILGIPTLVQFAKHRGLKLRIIGNKDVIDALQELFHATATKYDGFVEFIEAHQGVDLNLDSFRLRFASASHVLPSLAVRVEVDDRCVVYTGDTSYSDAIAELAKGCDLLIHEVAGYSETVHMYGHSTLYDVLRVVKQSRVKLLALIHFYIQTPILRAEVLKELADAGTDLLIPFPGYILEL